MNDRQASPASWSDAYVQKAQDLSQDVSQDTLHRASAMLDTGKLQKALQQGDTKALQAAMQQLLSTKDGQQLLAQVRQALAQT